jgi:DNA gyrase inhibitor GyrI
MKILIIIVLAIVATAFGVYAYLGGFQKINFSIRDAGGEVLVYENHIGEYKNTGPVMDKIYYSLLEEEKIETYKGFGIYYDDPSKVDKTKLRSEVGCILENPDAETLERLNGKYKIKTFPKGSYLVAEFPYKGKMSVIMGIMRVYPVMNTFIKEHNIAEDGYIMEIYDVPGKRIEYRKTL